jgi:hypothetical protein
MRALPLTYDQFIPEFLGMLFTPGEQVRVAVLHGPGDMRNELLPSETAVERLQALQHTPNLYFACSTFTPTGGYTKADCVSTRAVCLDVDYGTAGHRSAPFFETAEDAWACLMTAPVTPTCVWHTGHGLQAVYALDQPYVFTPVNAERIADYEAVSRKLAAMVQSDATFTPEHLFRVPLTVNAKPDTPPVQGQLLYWDPDRRLAFSDLQAICERYGVPEEADTEEAEQPQEQLNPADLSHDDRSGAMFEIITRMHQAGYNPDAIHAAIKQGQDFTRKYGRRLQAEIDRCIVKISNMPGVYADAHMPLDVVNIAEDVTIGECAPLTPEMSGMVDRYIHECDIAQPDRVQLAARFHEHLFQHKGSGVMETPCGYGKSTWAQCHIAVNGHAAHKYLYVVDTIDALYRAAETIETLNPELSAGRYHAFNADRCFALCGVHHSWNQCRRNDPASVCRKCEARTKCAFYSHRDELDKPVVIMCHNGFVRLLESEDAEVMLETARIIVDEDLNAFLSTEFTHEDLILVEQFVGSTGGSIKPYFPYTSFAAAGSGLHIQAGSITYAAIHYVYRDEAQTAELSDNTIELRKALGIGKLNMFKHSEADVEHARQVLCELLTYFRPAYRGDARYAYREIRDAKQKQVRYQVKKNRYSFGDKPVGEKLWILNASAQLSPHPYPSTLPVYGCPELQPDGHLLGLHVIAGNPMQSKREAHVDTAIRIIRDVCLDRQHKAAFIATNKDAASFDEAVPTVPLARGRIRGSNKAGKCTFACLAGLSLFTSIDNVGVTAAIALCRTIPVTPAVFTKEGAPSMPGGRFRLKLMREIYALSALDELYQALWRTAVRNQEQVEAIVVIPDAEWLSVLWRTVMPGYRTYAVYKPVETDFSVDLAMDGFVYLMGVEPGREFKKQDIAALLGYSGAYAWKDNQRRIRRLLDPFFEDGSSNRILRRRAI